MSQKQLEALAQAVGKLIVEVQAIQHELASLPREYVVPGPNRETPPGTIIVNAKGEQSGADFDGRPGAL